MQVIGDGQQQGEQHAQRLAQVQTHHYAGMMPQYVNGLPVCETHVLSMDIFSVVKLL